ELIHRAKALGSEGPFILLTGYGSGALDEAACREGAADYVEKHLVGTQLERSIRCVLRSHSTVREQRQRDARLRHVEATDALRRMAGHLAREFGELLAAIRAGANRLAIGTLHSAPLARGVEDICRLADRGAALAHDLLRFAGE